MFVKILTTSTSSLDHPPTNSGNKRDLSMPQNGNSLPFHLPTTKTTLCQPGLPTVVVLHFADIKCCKFRPTGLRSKHLETVKPTRT